MVAAPLGTVVMGDVGAPPASGTPSLAQARQQRAMSLLLSPGTCRMWRSSLLVLVAGTMPLFVSHPGSPQLHSPSPVPLSICS